MRSLNAATDATGCDSIIRALPDFFGVQSGLVECERAIRHEDGLVAVEGEQLVGFLTYTHHNVVSVEITWMAVAPERRNQGLGWTLL
ncbi:MAG: GNAT family N-acetyltransferase, partial [Actinobacteria bacterium]|nr:GNAT family N-acetyltransferase [Actinomycetota bacterium]